MSTDRAVIAPGGFIDDTFIGPPGWNQRLNIELGNPYYVPNPSVGAAGGCFVVCSIIAVCAAFTTRGKKNKISNPISHYFFGWPRCRYWITMGLALLSFSWQTFDDIFRIVNSYAEQRLFLTQFVFDCFWDFTRIFLLWNTYDLLFHLMRYAPLGQHTICRLHFWRYEIVRQVICGILFLIAFVMMCLRISYLSDQVFHPPMSQDKTYFQSYATLDAAVELCFLHDILYFLAGLEVLVVSGVLLERKNSKDGAGSKAAYIFTLVWITAPIFLAGMFTFINTCVRPPPSANFTGATTPDGDNTNLTTQAIQIANSIFGCFGLVLPFAGILIVAKRMDALMGKGERLTSESTETVNIRLTAQNLGRSDAYPASLKSEGDRPGTGSSNYEVRIVGGAEAV